MDNINLRVAPIRDCEDERFQRRMERFFDHLESYGKTIPKETYLPGTGGIKNEIYV